jgi:hypothetical protein
MNCIQLTLNPRPYEREGSIPLFIESSAAHIVSKDVGSCVRGPLHRHDQTTCSTAELEKLPNYTAVTHSQIYAVALS